LAKFDFDMVIDRRGGDSHKWNRYAGRDVIPLWVADMDFAIPPVVQEALHRRIDHGVFGYARPWPSLTEAVCSHIQRHYQWQIDPAWIVWIPGIVAALNVACRSIGKDGDTVFTHTPVYPPFLSAPGLSSRRLVTTPLLQRNDRWQIDIDATDAALKAEAAKLWLLCHPHNPVGRAWEEDELQDMAQLAKKHDLIVCSDEIHCGLVLDAGKRHVPFATLSADAASRSITLMAPSKTFNLPGLYCGLAIIPDATLRRRFSDVMEGIMPHVNTLGWVAAEAAYRDADPWRLALIDYLFSNAKLVKQAIAKMPGLKTSPVEATCLAWIDCRELCQQRGMENPQRFFEAAGVGLSDGADFGAPGFVRLNFGCPRSTLEAALQRMAKALNVAP